jgi:cyclophilin family peptidyl-prolyl cis-trans isomerase/HEAT repeat protein
MTRIGAGPRGVALAALVTAAACSGAPPPAVVAAKPAEPSFNQKMAWILRLEDQRILRDQSPVVAPAPPAPVRGQKAPVVTPPAPPPDLTRMLTDDEARIRRRAALAVGRVGLHDGVQPLLPLLASDPEPEVRQMAAFALGLLADARAKDPLAAALADPSPLVKGSAAEALGLLGDASAADAVGRMVADLAGSGALREVPGDEDDVRRDTPSAACRVGIFALVRLKGFTQLAAAALDAGGQPRAAWWPIAFALQRLEDPRGLPALRTLAKNGNAYTRAFAVKGLGALKDHEALPTLMQLLSSGDRAVLVETVRALGRIGDASAAAPLQKILHDPATDPAVRLEAVTALGGIHAMAGVLPPGVVDDVLDLLSDSSPPIRAAALHAIAALDAENLVLVLSGLDPDPHWSVRASLAALLGTLAPDTAIPRLTSMLLDQDQRVIPSVLAAFAKLKPANAAAVLLDHLKADDAIVRSAAAAGVGDLLPANGATALAEAYQFGQRDTTYSARTAALAALAKYGAAAAMPSLRAALGDKDWAVRVRAAMLVKELDPAAGDVDAQIRPAPTTVAPDVYQAARVDDPPVSTHAFIDTDKGSIEIELAVLDAPLTVENFVTLARKGFFNGVGIHRVVPNFVVQDGDPRGDGEGGPGYTIRDELNQRPYLRGTVGMALDPWRDTGGSQFFITHSPQPHLDAKYTVFGRVVDGMDVVDRIQAWDVIRRVRVWDGNQMTDGPGIGARRN